MPPAHRSRLERFVGCLLLTRPMVEGTHDAHAGIAAFVGGACERRSVVISNEAIMQAPSKSAVDGQHVPHSYTSRAVRTILQLCCTPSYVSNQSKPTKGHVDIGVLSERCSPYARKNIISPPCTGTTTSPEPAPALPSTAKPPALAKETQSPKQL